MISIGIDICNVKRFDRLKENRAFLKRVFAESELEICLKRKRISECLAVRFAAKEAFVKAIGTGIRDGIKLREIVIRKNEIGRPFISLEGETEEYYNRINGGQINLSLSHEKEFAIAVVIIEKKEV